MKYTNKKFLVRVSTAIVLFLISLIVNFYAGTFATARASNAVNDLVLNNIPVFNVDLFFVYGPLVVWFFVAWFCLIKPQRIPFVFKSLALFVLTRSLFITLTHIGPFPDHAIIDYSSDFIKRFSFGGDLFFSAHTGLPFLMALVFWRHRRLRLFFISASIFFGVIVLLGHLHYSIDVLSAFFITYSIYHLALYLFKEDARLFNDGLG